MRKSNFFLIYLALNIILVGLMFLHADWEKNVRTKALAAKRELGQRLGITDLCLFTEASYTRHLSQADVFIAFQDGPSLPDHFPSGALVRPLQTLKKPNEKLD